MFTLNCKGRLLVIEEPVVMGIINVTPDSFYAGSRFVDKTEVLQQAEKMIKEGAAILDIGGQSTRPGSQQLDESEEMERVIGPIRWIHEQFPETILSIDTYRSGVARESVEAGASMVNDIGAGNLDDAMLETVGRLGVPYVCMHMQGTPRNMQQEPYYENVTREVLDFFIAKAEACRLAHIHDVIFDIGFGFGKTSRHNFELLNNLSVFRMLERPLLLGVSRKSSISRALGVTVTEALNGTTVLHAVGVQNGAAILRAHDVLEAKQVIQLVSLLNKSK